MMIFQGGRLWSWWGEMYYSDNDGYDRPILLLETMEVVSLDV